MRRPRAILVALLSLLFFAALPAQATRTLPSLANSFRTQAPIERSLRREADVSAAVKSFRLFGEADLVFPPRVLELGELRHERSCNYDVLTFDYDEGANLVAESRHFDLRLTGPGVVASRTFPGTGPSLFQGAWTDPTTGIAYHRNRWYDPRIASWLSEDPAGAVDSPNLYAFVGWGPQVGRDPLGLCVLGMPCPDWMKSTAGYVAGLGLSAGELVAAPVTMAATETADAYSNGRRLLSAYRSRGLQGASEEAERIGDEESKKSKRRLVGMVPFVNTYRQGSQVIRTYEEEGTFAGGMQLGRTTFSLGLDATFVYGVTRFAAAKTAPAPTTNAPRMNLLNNKVPTNSSVAELTDVAEANIAARVAQSQQRTGPVQPGETTTFQEFRSRSVVGDGIEGHELWQHANINEQGLAQTRLSSPASRQNPVLAMEKADHSAVNRAQPQNPRAQTPLANISANAQVLRDWGVPDFVVRRLEEMAIAHAWKSGKHF